MAQLLAPYNNAMRLGQGFNSYTQQICLDQAVLPSTHANREKLAQILKSPVSELAGNTSLSRPGIGQRSKSIESYDQAGEETEGSSEERVDEVARQRSELLHGTASASRGDDSTSETPQWVKPQIVTYSSRFVDKLSDVTDAMNISGSLSIKTATIGGKANGSYVDSDKFKQSDINFHLQVKVTNQIHDAIDYNIFNKVQNVKKEEFAQVYGDSFISGWETGGELNAIVSMKVRDKAKIFEVKAGLEAQLNVGAVSGDVKAEVGIEKKNLDKETETTITVNWSGGGSIKNPSEDWSITSLKKAAAAFPELVAITPQRTYAILTRYTALASFHAQKTEFSPLQYENAGIYTGALLDHYMDYKSLWKQISHATYELESNRATIDMAIPTEDIYELAALQPWQGVEGNTAGQRTTPQPGRGTQGDSNLIYHKVFHPTIPGLIAARKTCRMEMAKIVREVDIIATNPTLATEFGRDSYFLHPLIFKQLLPIVRSLSPEDAKLGVRDPTAALLLGYYQPDHHVGALPPLQIFPRKFDVYDTQIQNMVQRMAYKARDYRMEGVAGQCVNSQEATQPGQGPMQLHANAEGTNDLNFLDATYRMWQISFFKSEDRIKGIKIEYASGEPRTHGECTSSPSDVVKLAIDGSEIITEVTVKHALLQDNTVVIAGLNFATSLCKVYDVEVDIIRSITTTNTTTSTISKPKSVVPHSWVKPDDLQWSLRGFFTFSHNQGINSLGVIWGKDTFVPVPKAKISTPIAKRFLGLSPRLQDNLRRFKQLPTFEKYADKFILGKTMSINADPASSAAFNALDTIDFSWRIKSIAFCTKTKKLTGLRVTYHNGQAITHGTHTIDTEKWTCEVKSDLVVAKIAADKIPNTAELYIDTVEFVRLDDLGNLPAWPFEVSTLRYLGEGEDRNTRELKDMVEQAPKMSNVQWSVRGFYGETNNGIISRLGVVWGRS